MKTGFRIDIQSDLNDKELIIAKNTCDNFIIYTLKDPKKRYGGIKSYGGRDTPYSRGSGILLNDNLYFMRINRHKRIFGVVKKNNVSYNGKFTFKNNIQPPMFTYAQIGDIKG